MTDWDASRYQRISGPQFDWGQGVIARLTPAPGERIRDLGGGTGRLTHEISRLMTHGRIVGLLTKQFREDTRPFVLDYQRFNINASRNGA